MEPVILLVSAFAGARMWRLLAVDEIALPFRNRYYRVMSRWYDWADSLLRCPFCMGFWLTLIWTLTGLAWGDTIWWWVAAGPFAANYVGGTLNAWSDVRPITESGGEIPPEET